MTYPELNHPPAERGAVGRPGKFTPKVLRRVLRHARRGLPLTLICKAIGVSTQGLINYRREHPRFEAALQRSIALGMDLRLRKIEQAAQKQDWRAAAWMLEHLMPELFAKNRLEVTGAGGAPLAGVVAIVLPPKTDGNGSPAVIAAPVRTIEDAN